MDKQGEDGANLQKVSKVVYLLICTFGLSAWIAVNGLWIEMPILVNILPEGWQLPSIITITIQLANVGPLFYTVLNKYSPHRIKQSAVIYGILFTGATSLLLLAAFWRHTVVIGQTEHSIVLIILAGLLALVDCTSSVVYLPYVGNFKTSYMSALYVGEGMGGVIPAMAGIVQGTSTSQHCINKTEIYHNETNNYTTYVLVPQHSPPLFSETVFFMMLFCLVIASAVAFTFLHCAQFCQKEKVYENIVTTTIPRSDDADADEDTHLVVKSTNSENVCSDTNHQFADRQYKFRVVASSLLCTAWINAFSNGILKATQTYTALPYSQLTYNLMVSLSVLLNPVASFAAVFFSSSVKLLNIFTVAGTCLSGYLLYVASMSPFPPLRDEVLGKVLVMGCSMLVTVLFSYAKVTAATIVQQHSRETLIWCGMVAQIGSLVGALTGFLAVNVFSLFKTPPVC